MYGVSKITVEPGVMMISVQDAAFSAGSLARYLQIFADTGIVVDMISQSAPHGTRPGLQLHRIQQRPAPGHESHLGRQAGPRRQGRPSHQRGLLQAEPLWRGDVASCGVAARALSALASAGIEVHLITTSDLDISLLVRSENEDAAYDALRKAYEL